MLESADYRQPTQSAHYGRDATSALHRLLQAGLGDRQVISLLVSAEPSSSIRLAAVDLCATLLLVALLYIDDIVAPASSPEQLRQIWKACEAFTTLHGPKFNIGPRKTATLLIGAASTCFDGETCRYFD